MRARYYFTLFAVLWVCSALQPAQAQLTINTSSATDWKIANGTISLDFDSTIGNVWSMYLTGYSTDLVDTTHCCMDGHPYGLYMDNTGTGFAAIQQGPSGVTPTAGYSLVAGSYIDWWMYWAPTSASPFGIAQHYIVQPNDPTLYAYMVVTHSSSAAAGNFGQLQYVYRISQTEFVDTYQLNSGLNNLGGWSITLPSEAEMGTTDPGRAVQNAVVDLHGFSLPTDFGREFYTKYDYSSYEYLLQVNGEYGPNFGAWAVLPSPEYMAGGPTKQVETYTGNILMGELLSGHLANEISYSVNADETSTRIWGPIGFHFNRFSNLSTMYQDALSIIPGALTLFGKDAELTTNGYVPNGGGRGTLQANITGGGSSTANAAWTVLSDQNKNMQYSSFGPQYWASNNSGGSASIDNVTPGTYRLSSYVLGEWGQLREDGVKINSGSTTTASLTFTPENFSSESPVWTIGTPDRSAHEFLHGENNYGSTGSCAGCDDREYQGAWNYWLDFESTDGAPVYYATAVGSTPPTNDTLKWNYVHWGEFDPGLYAGIYNSSDDTTDGYKYILPSYVSSVTATVPAWQVHFATTAAQNAQGSYVDLSIGLAATESNLTASLNGHAITWSAKNQSDADVRSGLSGYYQWMVFEWPTSDLVAVGGNNELTLSVSGDGGNMYDALRMEISSKGANPSVTGWHDYEYLSSTGTDTAEDASVSNNNTGTVVTGGGTASFTIAPSATTLSIAQGASGTDAITVTDVNGFSGTVTYVASGLPSGVTAAFNGNTITLTASTSATAGTSNITITGTSGSTTATTTIALTLSNTSGGAGGCTVDYTISPQNTGAFGAAITLVNNSTTAWTSWKLTWTFANGQTISSLWNGNETQSGVAVTVTNESYNGSIAAGARLTGIGFNGTWNGTTNAVPTSISLNGIACTVN